MGTHQQFCLRWNNHQSNFLSVFDDLLKHETLVDVTLACEGLSLKAHKVVLSACSPYFQHLFLDNPCKHPIVILKDIKFMDMKTLIDFMYKGEVNVSHDQLSTLLRVADTLKVKGLAEVTENMALQGTETAPPQTGGSAPQAAQAPQQQQHTRPDPSINSVSPPPKRRKKSRKTSGGSNGHSDDVDSGGGNNTFGQASAEMRSEVVPKNESSEQNYDNAGLLKSCAVVESASRSGGLSRSTASASQQASISQESSSHTHSYTNKNSLEVPQLYESSSGDMEADVSYRSTGLQHLSGRQDESTASPNTQAHLPSTSSSSHADQSEYFATTADATTPSTSRTSNSQGGRRSSKSGKKKTDTYDSNISDESQTKHKNRKQHHSSVEIKPHVRTHQKNCIMELIEVATKLIDEASVTEKTSARASETHLSRNTVNLTRKCQELLNKANKLKAENPAFHFKTTSLQREINDTKDLKQLMSGLGKLKNSLNAAINVKDETSKTDRSKADLSSDKDQVELIKDSGVYLSRHKITACRDAANPQILVRNLVTACFPMEVLLTSTVRGKRKSKEVDFRPALDPVIIDAILEYACQKFNLPRPFADAKLVRAIGQKLIDLRSTKLSYLSHPTS